MEAEEKLRLEALSDAKLKMRAMRDYLRTAMELVDRDPITAEEYVRLVVDRGERAAKFLEDANRA